MYMIESPKGKKNAHILIQSLYDYNIASPIIPVSFSVVFRLFKVEAT